jgi:hypothetical protein
LELSSQCGMTGRRHKKLSKDSKAFSPVLRIVPAFYIPSKDAS